MCGKSNTSTTNQRPDPRAMRAYLNVFRRAEKAAETPYEAYKGDLVANPNGDMARAYDSIRDIQGLAQPSWNKAQAQFDRAGQPIVAKEFSQAEIDKYLNPYIDTVVDSTAANIQRENAIAQRRLQGNAIARGSFGGDRSGVAAAELERSQGLARNQTMAELMSQGYGQALGMFNTQQGVDLNTQQQNVANALQAGQQWYNFGQGQVSTGLQAANAQLQAGQLQQQQRQNELNANYQQWQNRKAYPFQSIGWLGNIVSGVGNQTGGSSTTTSPGPSIASGLIGLGTAGLGALGPSDRRLKENISRVGRTDDGQPIYKFRFKDDPSGRVQMGLMAQEVEKKHPDAVHEGVGGVKFVDYDAATSKAAGGGVAAAGGLMPYEQSAIGPDPFGTRQDDFILRVPGLALGGGVDEDPYGGGGIGYVPKAKPIGGGGKWGINAPAPEKPEGLMGTGVSTKELTDFGKGVKTAMPKIKGVLGIGQTKEDEQIATNGLYAHGGGVAAFGRGGGDRSGGSKSDAGNLNTAGMSGQTLNDTRFNGSPQPTMQYQGTPTASAWNPWGGPVQGAPAINSAWGQPAPPNPYGFAYTPFNGPVPNSRPPGTYNGIGGVPGQQINGRTYSAPTRGGQPARGGQPSRGGVAGAAGGGQPTGGVMGAGYSGPMSDAGYGSVADPNNYGGFSGHGYGTHDYGVGAQMTGFTGGDNFGFTDFSGNSPSSNGPSSGGSSGGYSGAGSGGFGGTDGAESRARGGRTVVQGPPPGMPPSAPAMPAPGFTQTRVRQGNPQAPMGHQTRMEGGGGDAVGGPGAGSPGPNLGNGFDGRTSFNSVDPGMANDGRTSTPGTGGYQHDSPFMGELRDDGGWANVGGWQNAGSFLQGRYDNMPAARDVPNYGGGVTGFDRGMWGGSGFTTGGGFGSNASGGYSESGVGANGGFGGGSPGGFGGPDGFDSRARGGPVVKKVAPRGLAAASMQTRASGVGGFDGSQNSGAPPDPSRISGAFDVFNDGQARINSGFGMYDAPQAPPDFDFTHFDAQGNPTGPGYTAAPGRQFFDPYRSTAPLGTRLPAGMFPPAAPVPPTVTVVSGGRKVTVPNPALAGGPAPAGQPAAGYSGPTTDAGYGNVPDPNNYGGFAGHGYGTHDYGVGAQMTGFTGADNFGFTDFSGNSPSSNGPSSGGSSGGYSGAGSGGFGGADGAESRARGGGVSPRGFASGGVPMSPMMTEEEAREILAKEEAGSAADLARFKAQGVAEGKINPKTGLKPDVPPAVLNPEAERRVIRGGSRIPVVAEAREPEGVARIARAAGEPAGVAPAAIDKPAPKGGFEGLWSKIKGTATGEGEGFSPETRAALMAAGFGMMAGTNRNAFVNIGQGGTKGVEQYNTGITQGQANRRLDLTATQLAQDLQRIGIERDATNEQISASRRIGIDPKLIVDENNNPKRLLFGANGLPENGAVSKPVAPPLPGGGAAGTPGGAAVEAGKETLEKVLNTSGDAGPRSINEKVEAPALANDEKGTLWVEPLRKRYDERSAGAIERTQGGARAAQANVQRLRTLEHVIDAAPKSGFFSPGATVEARTGIGAAILDAATVAGISPSKTAGLSRDVGNAQEWNKTVRTMAAEIAAAGGQESFSGYTASLESVPSNRLAEVGSRRILEGLKAINQRQLDKATFMESWQRQNPGVPLDTMERAFDVRYPPDLYATRAIAMSIPKAKVNAFLRDDHPQAAADFDAAYGKGSAAAVKRFKWGE